MRPGRARPLDDVTLDARAAGILSALPVYGRGNADLLDVIAKWAADGQSGGAIQDAIEALWNAGLVFTDQEDALPVFPRCRTLCASPNGDALMKARMIERPKVIHRLIDGLERLKTARKMNNKDMSVCLGVTDAYVSQLMHGQRDIKVSMLDRLVNQTGLQLFDLLGPDPEDSAREPTPSLPPDTGD